MKRLLLAAVLLASCSVPASELKPVPPDYALKYANATCDKDADYVAAHVSGRLSAPVAAIRSYFASVPTCTAVRYLGSLKGEDGEQQVFVLTEDGVEVWYVLHINADHLVTWIE